MKGYILGIAGTAILSAVISIISPGKKMGRVINGVLKLCMVSALVVPLLDLFRQTSEKFFSQTSITTENAAYINNSYALAIDKYIEGKFDITVEVEYDGTKIKIYVTDYGENGTDKSDILSDIEREVSELCDIKDTEVYDESNR